MRQDVSSKQARRDLKPWIGAVITGLTLAGCGRQAAGPQLPADAPSALVLGAVNSPVYDELGKSVRMTPYDGSQKAADNDLVILDGDVNTPQAVQKDGLVGEALRAGKAVLMVDASEAHKREGLGKLLGFASRGQSPGYLARLAYDRNHRPAVCVVEFPGKITPTFSDGTSAGPVGASDSGVTAAFTHKALAALAAPCGKSAGTSLGGVQDGSGETLPTGAIYKHVYYALPALWYAGATEYVKGSQTLYFNTNYTFTIILDDNDNQQSDFQWVAAEADVEAIASGSPQTGVQPIESNQLQEKGWFQHRIKVGMQPVSDSLFTSVADSPPNADTKVQVTTGFSVTVSGDPNASYSNSQTVELPDWRVNNLSAGNMKSWEFESANPIDADKLSDGFNLIGTPKTPNAISLGQAQFSAQAVWKTSDVQTGSTDFNLWTEQDVADLFCGEGISLRCSEDTPRTGAIAVPKTVTIDLGAVAPIDINAITFNSNPAVAGQPVTGTVILNNAAPVNTLINLSSNSPNATVLSTTTVPQGQTNANFQILTNANGLSSGGSTTATLIASYAEDSKISGQAQLTVNADAPTGLQPPTTAPGRDNLDWAQTVPQGSRWVSGYQVRYAVSFVDAAGTETVRGPWTDWIAASPYALPFLTDIATDPTGTAVARNVYRQFLVDYNPTDLAAGVTNVITLNDNTTTSARDANIPQ